MRGASPLPLRYNFLNPLFHLSPQARLPLLLLAAALLSCSASSLPRVAGNGRIRNGALKRDVEKKEMDTHDGNVVQFEAGGPYYMYR